jgi:hypothetical protein
MGKYVPTHVFSTYVTGLGMNCDGTLGELITFTAVRGHHEHCYIARKKSALTETFVRFNIYIVIQAYSSWNPKKL